MAALGTDLRHSVRVLRQSPGLTALAILTLGWGIGSCTGAFSLINAFLLRPLPFAQADRLVHVWATDRVHHEPRVRVSLPDYLDLRDRSHDVADLAAFTYRETTLGGTAEPETLASCSLTTNAFQLLGVEPAAGRALGPDDEPMGAAPVVVISAGLWKRKFGGQPVVGQTIQLDGVPHTIVGIMPPSFAFPLNTTDLWTPQSLDLARHQRDSRFLQILGRLKPGVTRAQAQAAMRAVAKQLEKEHPVEDADHGVWVVPLREGLNVAFETIVPIAVVLAVTNIIVLLIVCANVGGLALASAVTRTREMAIRLALGSGRRRIMRQLLIQSVLTALPGGALGVLLAVWSVEAAARSIPAAVYHTGAIAVDTQALTFALVLSVVTAVTFGFVPAWRASRTDVVAHLKEEGPTSTGGRATVRFRGMLVLSQVALGSMLVMAAGLLLVTLARLQRVELGFAADRALTLKLRLPASRYPGDPQLVSFQTRLLERIRGVPGVSSVALVNTLPLDHETAEAEFQPGSEPAAGTKGPVANVATVSPGYFETLGITLFSGRSFAASDALGSAPVAIVNRALARRWLSKSQAVGQILLVRNGTQWRGLRIVGVADDARQDGLNGDVAPQIYISQGQTPTRYAALITRTQAADAKALAPAIRGAIHELDGTLAATDVRSLRDIVDAFLAPQRSMALAVGRLALGALLLVIVGVYGIVAHAVALRTYEVGVRVALGASRRAVVLLILRQAFKYLLPGLVLGLAGALVLGRMLSHVVVGAATANFAIAAIVMALVTAVALVACWLPARRVLAVDPAGALRSL